MLVMINISLTFPNPLILNPPGIIFLLKSIKGVYMKLEDTRGITTSSTSVEEVKERILSWFRDRKCKAGDVMGFRDVTMLSIGLNPKQNDVLESAINELIEEGFINILEKGWELTQQGVDRIY